MDLSSFNISLVDKADNMFDNCNSLIFLNLISFEEKKIYYYFSFNPFRKISKDVVYCIDEDKSPIFSYAFKVQNLTNNCSDICFLDTKKINIEERKCIFYCEKSEICKYGNKDICCDKCPEGTKPKNNVCEEKSTDFITNTDLLTDTNLLTDLLSEKYETKNCTSEMFFKKICGTNNISEQDNIINNINLWISVILIFAFFIS